MTETPDWFLEKQICHWWPVDRREKSEEVGLVILTHQGFIKPRLILN